MRDDKRRVHSERDVRHIMDKVWQHHEIELLDNNTKLSLSLETLENSLNSNAQDMHKKFLLNLPHLSEVQKKHQTIVTDITTDLEETKMKIREVKALDDILLEFGGESTNSGLSIPLPSEYPNDFVIRTTSENDTEIVQIISSEVFGGLLRTFKLPPGKETGRITWKNGIIELLYL